MVNTGPSPAEIVEFEEEVNNRSMKTDYKSGVQNAIRWVLGRGDKKHPFTNESMKCAPGWKEIDHTAKEAQAKVDNKRLDTRHECN